MPTTNQALEEGTLADKIPPTVAAGFEKVATAAGNALVGGIKKSAGEGMSTS